MRALVVALLVAACEATHAQEKPTTAAAVPVSAGDPGTPSDPAAPGDAAPPTAGQGRPPILIPASTDRVVRRLQLALPADLAAGDLELGLLDADQGPAYQLVPQIELVSKQAVDGRPLDVELRFTGLFPFGESRAPLLYQGRQIETLTFHKAGVLVSPPSGDRFIARESDDSMLLVLQNPTAFTYPVVRARLRFEGADVCAFEADSHEAPPRAAATPTTARPCTDGGQWSTFAIPASSHVSLRAKVLPQWFLDPQSQRARSAERAGVLTLRYQGDTPGTWFEQHLPLDARFEPATGSLFRGIWRVGWLLFVGAMLSLVLRVSVPNYRRKKALKDQLEEARRAIAEISEQVDSQLRVLLRVDRLALDQRRREGWVLGPGFDEVASRVETGLATLQRKIALVQRMDAAGCRREALLEGPVAPTRLKIIDRNIDAACEALKSDQLSDADWIFIQQRLEAADKTLSEPSQEEKQAFEALLSQRWKSIRDHFGFDTKPRQPTDDTSEAIVDIDLRVPETLACMHDAFPVGALLPRKADEDGTAWIASIGIVRADLQLSALDTVREVQFLAPVLNGDGETHLEVWKGAMPKLTRWLATPAIATLAAANRLLLELAEDVDQQRIVEALRAREAYIDADPQLVNPNQTVRLTVRFRDPRLNGATARSAIQCEWQFHEPHMVRPWSPRLARVWKWIRSAPQADTARQKQTELGWRVHRYFPAGIESQVVEVRFFYDGKPVVDASGAPTVLSHTVMPTLRAHHQKDMLERWLWRPLPQALQLVAALLIPLTALAITTAGEANTGQWWDLVGLGFGSETIRNILSGEQTASAT